MGKLLMLNRQTGIPFRSSSTSDSLMMHVKVKTKGIRLTVPIPYVILNIAVSIGFSRFFQQKISEWTKESLEEKNSGFTLPPIDKKTLKPILKELKNSKGVVLVDVKAKDGTEVKIRL